MKLMKSIILCLALASPLNEEIRFEYKSVMSQVDKGQLEEKVKTIARRFAQKPYADFGHYDFERSPDILIIDVYNRRRFTAYVHPKNDILIFRSASLV